MFNLFKSLFNTAPSFDVQALKQRGAIVIDVRSPGEFHSGHIKGSTNIPLDQIMARREAIKAKNVPVIAVCRSGNRSGLATEWLTTAGVETYNGGAWDSLQEVW